jgi:hypothetical protein
MIAGRVLLDNTPMRTVIRLSVAWLADVKREARRRGLHPDELAAALL